MKDSRKMLVLCYVVTILLLGCSSQMTITKLNKPACKIFKEKIKQDKVWSKQYIKYDPDIVEKVISEDKYFFERQIKIRNSILDSLDLLKKDKFIIIDSRADNNGERVESSYFFYDNKVILAKFIRIDSISKGEVFTKYKPQIKEIDWQYFEKNLDGLYSIYRVFESSNAIPSQLGSGSERVSYLATVVRDNNVDYYSISGFDKYKIVKLN